MTLKSVYRRSTNGEPYTAVLNALLQSKVISIDTIGLIARLLSRPEDWEITIRGIMADLGAGEERVQRLVKEALQSGYLRRFEIRDEFGKIKKYHYCICDDPAWLAALDGPETGSPGRKKKLNEPLPEKPVTDKTEEPLPGKPLPGFRGQQSKDNNKEPLSPLSHCVPKETYAPSAENGARSAEPRCDPPRKAKPKKDQEPYTAEFEAFWKAYPRKVNCSKRKAFLVWMPLSAQEQAQAFRGAVAYAKKAAADATPERFLCHATTWLNQERFETIDEQPFSPEEIEKQKEAERKAATQLKTCIYFWQKRIDWKAFEFHGTEPGTPGCLIPKDIQDRAYETVHGHAPAKSAQSARTSNFEWGDAAYA